MSSLPKWLTPVRVAVASILYHRLHIDTLYNAEEIANAPIIKADIAENDVINAGADAALPRRTFANEGGECILPYNNLGREWSRDVLCIRREIKCERKV